MNQSPKMDSFNENSRSCVSENLHTSMQEEEKQPLKAQLIQIIERQRQLMLQVQEKDRFIEKLTEKTDYLTYIIINENNTEQHNQDAAKTQHPSNQTVSNDADVIRRRGCKRKNKSKNLAVIQKDKTSDIQGNRFQIVSSGEDNNVSKSFSAGEPDDSINFSISNEPTRSYSAGQPDDSINFTINNKPQIRENEKNPQQEETLNKERFRQ